MDSQTKNNFHRKIKASVFIFILTAAFLFPAQKPAEAVICWFLPCSGIMSVAMDLVKTAAKAAIQKKGIEAIDKAISGSSAGKYITDYKKFLTDNPEKEAKNWLNDQLTNTVAQGKSSATNYITKAQANAKTSMNNGNFEGVGPNSFKIGLYQNNPQIERFVETADAASLSENVSSSAGNYLNKLVTDAKKAVSSKAESAVVTYAGDPAKMFAEGNFKNLSKYTEGINNPWAFTSNAQVMIDKKEAELKETAKTVSVTSQGWVDQGMKMIEGKISGIPGAAKNLIFGETKMLGPQQIVNAQGIADAAMAVALNALTEKAFDGTSGGQTDQSDRSEQDAKNNENSKKTKEEEKNKAREKDTISKSKEFDGAQSISL